MVRIILVISLLSSSIAGISFLFWQHELKYQLPTPVPANYTPMATGTRVDTELLPQANAYFLHFYNPDCPCSRFNARHVKSLIRSYKENVSMIIIVPGRKDLDKAKLELGELEMVVDEEGLIAKACGVYSTPQAVIIDNNKTLFYRGNYNKSRYCTSRASNFAELSLIAMLHHQPAPSFGLMATTSYGCELPTETERELELF